MRAAVLVDMGHVIMSAFCLCRALRSSWWRVHHNMDFRVSQCVVQCDMPAMHRFGFIVRSVHISAQHNS